MQWKRHRAAWALLLLLGAEGLAWSADDVVDAAGQMRQREEALKAALRDSPFQQPIVVDSMEYGEELVSNVHALVAQPLPLVEQALARPSQWCDVLILHLNVKGCEASESSVTVYLGRKFEQPIARASALRLAFAIDASTPEYLHVRMRAPDGPRGTYDHAIDLEAVPAADGRTFVHFRYAMRSTVWSRLLLNVYLDTLGSGKVGFTRLPAGHGTTVPIEGARGAIERNAMRYYLALQVCLEGAARDREEVAERRMAAWFDATERYPAQLHEVTREEYLTMKRHELARQAQPAR